MIELIDKRKIKQTFDIKDFEEALTNIHLARGKSYKTALQLSQKDISDSIMSAGKEYTGNARNCFANEYYKNLQY